MKSLNFFPAIVPMILGVILAGCSTTPQSPAAKVTFTSPDHLTATLSCGSTNGCDATLHWEDHATADGGNWVEFATPGSEYTKLEVFLADHDPMTFVHPRLAPQTQFIYHVQPYFGNAAGPVEIMTGVADTNAPSDLGEGPLPDDTNAAPHKVAARKSIRSARTFAQAAPTNLTATLSSPTSVDLRWTDRASNEDGFLVELAAQPQGPFYVCALLPPDTTSFRKIQLPGQTKCYFRVRAFFYGKPSATASVNTP